MNIKLTILVLIFTPCFAQAITVANFSSSTNDRFTNDPSFIGADYDFSGVGRSTDTSSTKWATLIGDNYFISANHFHPGVGTNVQFFGGNSPSGTSFTYTVAGGFQVPGTDFWIGYTSTSIDASLARYNYTTTAANTLAETGWSGAQLLTSGDHTSGVAGSPTSHVVGTNAVESFINTGSSSFQSPQHTVNLSEAVTFDQIITFNNLSGDDTLSFTQHESQLQSGDSGSPLFTVSGGELLLLGTAWAIAANVSGNFIDTDGPVGSGGDPLEQREATFYAYIGSYETELNNTIALVPSAIPEPSALMLAVGSCGLLLRRKRA